MYGFVRPFKDELLVREYEDFQAVYCGLCHSLKRRYGPVARFILNYDFTYIAMLLWDSDGLCTEKRRCPASPLAKKRCCSACAALDTAADVSVILARYKLSDNLTDEGFFKKVGTLPAYWMAGGWMKKASKRMPGYAESIKKNLTELGELERERCDSIDMTADKFASCLTGAVGPEDGQRARIISQILYHTGRVVYILDAFADLKEDAAAGRYNAVAARYYEDGVLDETELKALRETINDSLAIMAADLELLPTGRFTPVLRNIITVGMPRTAELVLEGRYKPERRRELK